MKKVILFVFIGFLIVFFWLTSTYSLFSGVLFLITLFLLSQGSFATYSMLSSWLKPENLKRVSPPKKFSPKRLSFSLIIPVRNEEKVIAQTLAAMKKINYPKEKYEILITARDDDTKTVGKILESLNHLPPTFNLLVWENFPNSKPQGLNAALEYARGDIIGIFDAEDEPHPDILNVINTILQKKEADIVQSGVQLVNVDSHWYSPHNCLEYYFWFKSVLPFFSSWGANPLGGNTVFFKKDIVKDAAGWDEDCLTEDAEIGVRLSSLGKKTAVVYDEEMATKEETPPDLPGFIRQRTRWHQGFFQVLLKGNWKNLKNNRQKVIILYQMTYPFMQIFNSCWLIVTPFLAFFTKIPLGLALFSYLPGYFFLIQIGISLIGLHELNKNYQLKFSPLVYLKFLIFFFPYQIAISFSTLRAVKRHLAGIGFWEKTEHINAHRKAIV
ncbi:MAG: glycosyltransferase [Patescibacteria group bacterium]|jgi:cellulose synthase/poly-beta-1,6-N-acetylglucosamine synthase-like glycosyltransferase